MPYFVSASMWGYRAFECVKYTVVTKRVLRAGSWYCVSYGVGVRVLRAVSVWCYVWFGDIFAGRVLQMLIPFLKFGRF